MTEVVSVKRRNRKAVTAAGLLAAVLVFGLFLLGCNEDEIKNKFYTVVYEVTSTDVDLDTVTIETGTNNIRKLNPDMAHYHVEYVNVELAPSDWLYLAVSATGKKDVSGSITARIKVGSKVVDERTGNTLMNTGSGQAVWVQAKYSLEYNDN